MKAELTLPQELVDLIADKVIEKLKPMLSGNDKHKDNFVFNKKSLSEYLKLSQSAINKLIVNKQIPYFKIQPGQSGGVRFSKKDIDRWIQRQTIPEINPFTIRR